MPKPRIIYFQQYLAVGATEEYFYLLMQGMDKTRFDITFTCPRNVILDSLATKIEALGVKVYRYSLVTNNFLYWRSFFLKFRPDIVHFNDPCLDGIIAARLAGVPVSVMTHHTPELNRKYNLKGRIFEKIAFRYRRLNFIFTSEFDRETGIKKDKVSSDKSFVIYYGLPPEKFNQRYDKKKIYEEFLLPEDCRIIGNIGRLSSQKGQSYLIEAAPFIIERFKSVKLFFVGEGELESELKAEVQKKGLANYFIFTGHRTDIPRLLSAFEMLVMPSWFEGLCFAVIEASAMGLPVIATDVGGLRRSVIDGKTGILIPPHDPKTLAKTIIWMLEHPREAKEMGLAGRKYFEELFTQDRMVEKTEELYDILLRETTLAVS
jgi:glycosyltransferase involved in cell wall biosynthesis